MKPRRSKHIREVEITIIRKKLISMSIICISLTVRAQPSPRFHVEAWLPFRNCEMGYLLADNHIQFYMPLTLIVILCVV